LYVVIEKWWLELSLHPALPPSLPTERIPPLVIEEPPGAVATLIPAHFHHTLFEILKNAFKATVESGVRRNLNSMPAIQVRVSPSLPPSLPSSLLKIK